MSSPPVPAYSVIIPAFNEERVLARLLSALDRSSFGSFEVIVVSDASSDKTEIIARAARVTLLRSNVRRGPAAARNLGARAASAPFLIFLDADVVPEADTLAKIDQHLKRRPDVRCFSGVYSPQPVEDTWFQRYRSLLGHHYVRDLPSEAPSRLFVTAIAGVERALFDQVGGFDETARAVDAEDTEFGYRVSQVSTMYLFRDVSVRHEFPGFGRTWRNYYRRSAAWLVLFRQRKVFDDHTTTQQTALLRLLGAITALGSLVLPIALPLHCAYLTANRRFFALLVRKSRARELPLMYAADLCLSVAVLLGTARGALALFVDA